MGGLESQPESQVSFVCETKSEVDDQLYLREREREREICEGIGES